MEIPHSYYILNFYGYKSSCYTYSVSHLLKMQYSIMYMQMQIQSSFSLIKLFTIYKKKKLFAAIFIDNLIVFSFSFKMRIHWQNNFMNRECQWSGLWRLIQILCKFFVCEELFKFRFFTRTIRTLMFVDLWDYFEVWPSALNIIFCQFNLIISRKSLVEVQLLHNRIE